MVAAVKTAVEVTVPVEVEIPTGMTVEFFDKAIARSFAKDLQVKPLGQGRYAMQSSRDASLTYIVTATSCQCEGFQRFHRCYHVCRAAFEDAFDGPEPSAPAAHPAPWPEVAYAIEQHIDGTASVVEFFIRQRGDVRRSVIGTYQTVEEARAAIARATARRERGPVHAVACPVCAGWGCDRHGIACPHCHGMGETMQPVPSVAELIAAGRWPGQVIEKAA